jgi:hypothetical protein
MVGAAWRREPSKLSFVCLVAGVVSVVAVVVFSAADVRWASARIRATFPVRRGA